MGTEPEAGTQGESAVAAGLVVAGKYKLLHILGEGGMGAVWAATHLGLNQTVALKVISKSVADSAEVRSRFDHEAKAAAKLKSRYVVQVFDNGELPDGTPYMAMDLLEGESLGTRISRGPLPLHEAVTYLDQVARALDRAHELGIIHRDIKPENVFLARSHDDESGVTVKVLDFGIARFSPSEGGSQTRTGVMMGTPLYMSPEQARGLKSLDHRSDLYSAAIMAYTMVTGQNAFAGVSLVDLVLQVCTAPLPLFADRGLPSSLDVWFSKAANREPDQRFSRAREMSDAFAIAAGVRAGASPDSVVLSPSDLPAPTPAALIAATLASPGAMNSLTAASRTQIDPILAPPKRPARVWAMVALAVAASALGFAMVRKLVPAPRPPSDSFATTATLAPVPTSSPSATVASPPTPVASTTPAKAGADAGAPPPADSVATAPTPPPGKASGKPQTSKAHAPGAKPPPPTSAPPSQVEVGF